MNSLWYNNPHILLQDCNELYPFENFDDYKKWSILKSWISDYMELYQTDINNITNDYFNYRVDKLTKKLTKSHKNCIISIDKNLLVLSK